jgi:hypothetical protein
VLAGIPVTISPLLSFRWPLVSLRLALTNYFALTPSEFRSRGKMVPWYNRPEVPMATETTRRIFLGAVGAATATRSEASDTEK